MAVTEQKPIVSLGQPHALGVSRVNVDVGPVVVSIPETIGDYQRAGCAPIDIILGSALRNMDAIAQNLALLAYVVAQDHPRESGIMMRSAELQVAIDHLHQIADQVQISVPDAKARDGAKPD